MPDDSPPSATPFSLAEHDAGLTADFDAGDRGCGDGLARELRRHLEAVAVGERLRVTVRDPSAKADIPSVARLLGHRVLSEEPIGDGRLVITVERGK
jgi:TusA-related sulfurtransferase